MWGGGLKRGMREEGRSRRGGSGGGDGHPPHSKRRGGE